MRLGGAANDWLQLSRWLGRNSVVGSTSRRSCGASCRSGYESGQLQERPYSRSRFLEHPFRLDDAKPEHEPRCEALSALLSKSGIIPETTVVAYSSSAAVGAHIFWLLSYLGHDKVVVLNGGHQKWMAEGHLVTSTLSSFEPVLCTTLGKNAEAVAARDRDYRILTAEVQSALNRLDTLILDVRTSAEYHGKIFMTQPPTENERSSHIPGAVHLEFERAISY